MPIIGSLEMARRRVSADDTRAQLMLAGGIEAAQRTATLVQRLLAFARRQQLKVEPVSLAAVTAGMRDLIDRSLGPTIHVVIKIADDLPLANADAAQLESSLLNLAINARDAMPDGGTITIGGRYEAVGLPELKLKPRAYVVLSVTDTGSGMDAETLRKAIEPFYTTKGVSKGTGLGLSMVHGTAIQSGGTLLLQSAPGKGTTAEIWLPVAPRVAATRAFSPINRQAKRPLNIMLVDDDDASRRTVAEMLRETGHTVTEVSSGHVALDTLATLSDIDILVTDYLMPEMTGDALVARIRAQRPSIPVLVITGYANPDDIDSTLPRLAKPFVTEQLVSRIYEILDNGSNVVPLRKSARSPANEVR